MEFISTSTFCTNSESFKFSFQWAIQVEGVYSPVEIKLSYEINRLEITKTWAEQEIEELETNSIQISRSVLSGLKQIDFFDLLFQAESDHLLKKREILELVVDECFHKIYEVSDKLKIAQLIDAPRKLTGAIILFGSLIPLIIFNPNNISSESRDYSAVGNGMQFGLLSGVAASLAGASLPFALATIGVVGGVVAGTLAARKITVIV